MKFLSVFGVVFALFFCWNSKDLSAQEYEDKSIVVKQKDTTCHEFSNTSSFFLDQPQNIVYNFLYLGEFSVGSYCDVVDVCGVIIERRKILNRFLDFSGLDPGFYELFVYENREDLVPKVIKIIKK